MKEDVRQKMHSMIDDAIEKLRSHDIEVTRSAKSFSFGTPEACKSWMSEIIRKSDSTIDEFKWLKAYDEVTEWMSDTNGKGLLLTGPCGIGKTLILRAVLPVMFLMKYEKIIIYHSAQELNSLDLSVCGYRCYDDIGIEPLIKNRYGERSMVFCDLIDRVESTLDPVFIATNLTGKQLLERYGERTVDRLLRLCKTVKFTGESLRYD